MKKLSIELDSLGFFFAGKKQIKWQKTTMMAIKRQHCLRV
jgi:hypothetical protein